MNVKPYNGYTNYETWLVALWIDNSEGWQSDFQDKANDIWRDSESSEYCTREDEAKRKLAKIIEEEIDELNPLSDAGMFTDLLNAALSEVDWEDIAENYIDEIDKEEELEEVE